MPAPPNKHAELVAELFKSALEFDPQDRQSFLEERCRSNPELRAEVESLLQVHNHAEQFMETPAMHVAAQSFAYQGAFAAGQVIGDYEIVSLIGKGGMGEVYLAQDRQLHRRVALKLVRRGMDTDDIVRRFHHEQQLLASLNHPNIGQLYGAGVTADGIPFFAMEHVEGTRIDDYCRERELPIEARLALFSKVCAAIHYAHQHLVVHRDIKPSNILVTAEGEPKLLDFGIAKLLDAVTNIAPELTITLQNVMTPEYASPEHVRGEPITTASDVYSLGVLLYELLTGAKPYKIDNRTPVEIARVITEQEPTKPSTAAKDRESRFEIRESDGSRFTVHDSRALRGDLDNIVLMAMRKEPQRRYSSVAQFSGDIRRHLDGLPVRARKDTFGYRSSKFIKRHRVGVGAAALLMLSLLGGIVTTLVQSHKAQKERGKAETINEFLSQMLNYSEPNTTLKKTEGQVITVKDVLDKAASQLGKENFSAQPEVRAELNSIIGESYASQGFFNLAEKHFRIAIEEQKRIGHGNNLGAVKMKIALADAVTSQGRNAEGEKLHREILPVLRSEFRKGNLEASYLATALHDFAVLRRAQGNSREAEDLLRESLALKPLASEKPNSIFNLIRGTLVLTLVDQGKIDEAIEKQRESVAELRQTSSGDTADFGYALTGLGSFLSEKGKFAEADANLTQGEKIYRRLLGDEHLWLGDNLRLQANSFYKQDRFAEAQSKIAETLKIYRNSSGPQYINYATALMIQGLILNQTGNSQQAERVLREAVKIREENLPKEHFLTALARSALGECLTTQRRLAEAEPLLLTSYESLKKSQGLDNPRTQVARKRLISLYENSGRADKAQRYSSEVPVQ